MGMNNCKFGGPDILKVKFAWCYYGKFGAATAVLKFLSFPSPPRMIENAVLTLEQLCC